MIEEVRSWLLGVVFASFAVSLVGELIPRGRDTALFRMVGGLFLVLTILRPFGTIRWELPEFSAVGTELQAELYREEQENALAAIIAERLEAYIWDKAIELGVDGTVRVAMICRKGVPLPESVAIRATYDPKLSAWIEEVVGIPAKKQIWLEESA